MRHYITKISQPKPYQELVSRTCDLCGIKASNADNWGGFEFNKNNTTIEISINQIEGNSWPEGGSGTEWNIDMCPNCFKNNLVPWLKSQGANIEEKEWDW